MADASDPTAAPAADGPTFANLFAARAAVCRGADAGCPLPPSSCHAWSSSPRRTSNGSSGHRSRTSWIECTFAIWSRSAEVGT